MIAHTTVLSAHDHPVREEVLSVVHEEGIRPVRMSTCLRPVKEERPKVWLGGDFFSFLAAILFYFPPLPTP